jgi:hypothetical protein
MFLFLSLTLMRPDFPYKRFPDYRENFSLLMETLAMDPGY